MINETSKIFQEFNTELDHMKSIKDYIILSDEEIDSYLNIMEKEIEIISKSRYTVLINNIYLIISKSIIKEYKYIVLFVLNNKELLINDSNYNNLLNLILIFSPEFYTIYNIKKLNCKFIPYYEFNFINIINEKNRKCSISWDYRLHLCKYMNEIRDYINSDHELINRIKKFNNMINLFDTVTNIFLLYDLMNIWEINQKEKRNYHLWKYIINISKIHSNENKLILLFCYFNFMNNTLDYSAYSTLRFLYSRIFLTNDEKQMLLDHTYKISSIKYDDNIYLCEFIILLNN